MRAPRLLLAPALVAGLAVIGCGGDEPTRTPTPTAWTPPAGIVPAGSVPVGCVGHWSSGPSGTVTCTAAGPNKDRVKVDKATFRLDEICVNDPRISSYTAAGGKTAAIALKPVGHGHCAAFAAVQELPESCTCVPPPGGDCTPPPGGFVCLAIGHVPLAES